MAVDPWVVGMTIRLYYNLLLLATVGCVGIPIYGVGDFPPDGNAALPLASAGADREILRGFPARLDGSATTHTADQSISFAWTQTAGEPVYLSSPSEPTPTFVAPLEEQTLAFKLTATDGVWSTSDQVSLLVRTRPALFAPQLLAGPDRVLDYNETPEPDSDDLPDGVPPDVEAAWERVEPAPVGNADSFQPELAVFRLTGVRDGLSSAPDYLLLFPYDETASRNVAPTASVRGPAELEPGESFRLDASMTSDPNGDSVRLRWVQARGDPLLPDDAGGARVSMHAPARPQSLVFRVYARDAVLESAAGELKISMPAEKDAPSVHPGQDRRTRPDREVRLDARADIPDGTPLQTTETFVWQQTLGTPVELTPDADGRSATFAAPSAPNELAFAVVATLAGVEGMPDVVRVSVVAEDDNLPPTIYYLSASSTTPPAGMEVEISTRVIDPEADPLGACELTADPPGVVDLPVCDVAAFAGGGEQLLKVVAPPAGTAVTITLTVCDDRDACADNSVRIVPQ